MDMQLVLTMNSIEDAKEDQFGMDDALRRQLRVVILRCGIPIRGLTLQHSNTPVA